MIRKNIPYSACWALALCLFLSGAAWALELGSATMSAAATPGAGSAADTTGPAQPVTEDEVRSFVSDRLAQTDLIPPGGKTQIDVGPFNRRLPACTRADLFVPPAMPLWGSARVGLRCLEGAHWTVYVPVQISVFGSALVLQRPVTAGRGVAAEDFRTEEIELTRETPGLLADPAGLERRVAVRYLPSGTLLRADHFRAKPVVVQGDPVRVVFLGDGFSVESEGTAATSATEGESVRVQVESGRVISGTAHEGRRVEIQ
jgi:flagella basal body P-ring formation protein FlgA